MNRCKENNLKWYIELLGDCHINKVVKNAYLERDSIQRLEKTIQAEKIDIARSKYEASKY